MNNILEHVPVHHLKCFTCKTINICSLELQKSKQFHGMVTIVCQKCNSSWKICYLHNCRFGQGRMNEAHQHFNDISHSILHQQRQKPANTTQTDMISKTSDLNKRCCAENASLTPSHKRVCYSSSKPSDIHQSSLPEKSLHFFKNKVTNTTNRHHIAVASAFNRRDVLASSEASFHILLTQFVSTLTAGQIAQCINIMHTFQILQHL